MSNPQEEIKRLNLLLEEKKEKIYQLEEEIKEREEERYEIWENYCIWKDCDIWNDMEYYVNTYVGRRWSYSLPMSEDAIKALRDEELGRCSCPLQL